MYSQIAANKRRSFFLLVGFVAFVGLVAYVLSHAFGRPSFFIPTLVFAIAYAAFSYFASAKIALAMSGARAVEKKDAPELYRIVENLSIAGGLPMPKVYIIDDPSPNAFATGRDPKHAVVAVTTGIMETLDKAELEGVIAHELSHIGNYDIRFMALVVALASVVSLLADLFLHLSFWGSDEEGGNTNPLMIILGIIGALLAPFIAMLVQLAISRRREYLADASGALLTRYPEGLARALAKIAQDPRGLKQANSATAPLYISNPLKGQSGGFGRALAGLLSTHPPMEERIRRLNEMGDKV